MPLILLLTSIFICAILFFLFKTKEHEYARESKYPDADKWRRFKNLSVAFAVISACAYIIYEGMQQ